MKRRSLGNRLDHMRHSPKACLLQVCAGLALGVSAAHAGPRWPIDVHNLSPQEVCAEYVRQSLRLEFQEECVALITSGGYQAENFLAYLALDDKMTVSVRTKYAQSGDAQAQYDLAQDYRKGRFGLEVDHEAATALLRQAAQLGHTSAQRDLGLLHLESHPTVKPEPQLAVHLLTSAAEQGDALAQRTLGRIFRHGWGVPTDKAQALKWLEKASVQDYAAATELGVMYEQGEFVQQDLEKAHKYYKRGALEDVEAMYLLAKTYFDGKGTEQDLASGAYWLSLAALDAMRAMESGSTGYSAAGLKQMFALIQYEAGRMYETGLGVKVDKAMAKRWYTRAAEAGFVQAEDALARLQVN